jgi:hypothetical protein
MALGLNSAANAVLPQSVGHALLAIKGACTFETASGAITLDSTRGSIHKIDPGGAGRDVTLEAEGVSAGVLRFIINGADNAETLTIKDDSPATIETIEQNTAALFFCDGTSWYFIFKQTIALT